jgi:hypothetical protein
MMSFLFSCQNEDNLNIIKHTSLYSPESKIKLSNSSGVYKNKKLPICFSDSNANKMVVILSNDTISINGSTLNYELNSLNPTISLIPTASKNYENYANSWSEPLSESSTFHQIKVMSYLNDSILDSAIGNYVLGAYSFDTLPIVNLKINNNWLFSQDSGCYVPGNSYDLKNDQITGNFYSFKKRKQPGYIQIIGQDKEYINGDYLFRIHGYITPLAPQKSLRFYIKEKTDLNKLLHLEHSVDKLILRSSFSGWGSEIFIDGWIADICSSLHLDVMAYVPTKLYLNGEYWGIHGLRERLDLKAISNKYDLKLKSIIDADDKGYSKNKGYGKLNELILKIKTNPNLSFEEVKSQFKMKSLVDWLIVELFFQNDDWPCNNTFFWKKTKDSKKWKAVLIDMDACVGDAKKDMFSIATKDRSPALGGVLITYLLNQPEFQELFKLRVNYLFQNELSKENLLIRYVCYKSLFEPIVEEHYQRWGDVDGLYKYEKGLKRIETFCNNRHKYFILNMNNYFKK